MSKLRDMDHSHLAHAGDVLAVSALLGTVGHILPPVAAVLPIIWYSLQIYESKAMQDWFKHRRTRHRHRRVRRAKAKTPPVS
jgi:hypothetical protein